MRHLCTLINTAFLFLITGSASAFEFENNEYPQQPLLAESGKVKKADKEFIKIIEKEIRNPRTPFPGEFGGGMTLTFIQRDKMNISLHLTSEEKFNQPANLFINPFAAADMISEGYFYFLPFMYDEKWGVCRHEKFYPTRAVIKIKYTFPNIGYRTQLMKPVSEICGWSNRDQTISQDTSFNVTAQRNLLSSYVEVFSQTLKTALGSIDDIMKFSVRLDGETLIYHWEDPYAKKPLDEKKLETAFFPPHVCQAIQQFTLLNIKVRFQILIGEEKDIRTIEKEAKQLCASHT